MKITVTAEDIKLGEPGASGRCPIAIAIRRATNATEAQVWSSSVQFDSAGFCIASLGYRAQRFIKHFDDNDPVKPFSFLLAVPK